VQSWKWSAVGIFTSTEQSWEWQPSSTSALQQHIVVHHWHCATIFQLCCSAHILNLSECFSFRCLQFWIFNAPIANSGIILKKVSDFHNFIKQFQNANTHIWGHSLQL
jgi:hypothetical protein